ncbi:4-alpha-glucanotransferase [Marinobacter sp. NP-4(2019)]|uniref:4-alpha-glucanotransferase n=1 Tax=Marinobacter sp. NP-4(2019) TaxID=2488665 RepID=UPI000FC3D0C1|nr:4-alpha-glucanotransferase [Marinobacter sp. NP-4(2019)]AZT83323.1 4-alpha-glucanotransferase [Marinobacter sp. NP-4(2019)]
MNQCDRQRRAGVLLHLTSLPHYPENGAFCHNAFQFIEFLAAAGFKYWQVLPMGPVNLGSSPYESLSAHAGNHRFISLKPLTNKGWLPFPSTTVMNEQEQRLHLNQAWQGFQRQGSSNDHQAFADFIAEQRHWLEDYALFMALRQAQDNRPWTQWPDDLRDRRSIPLQKARDRLREEIGQIRFEQFCFFCQWQAVLDYAHSFGIRLFGDLPLYVSHDSADVWSHRELFMLEANGEVRCVSGVPPDDFSPTGQRWGHPLFHWPTMEARGFQWWIERMQTQLKLYDLVRLDHFRGLAACWSIPAHCQNATGGHWASVPGARLLRALEEHFGPLPVVAEDLGIITEEVTRLREQFHLPGMKVLQFAFNDGPTNPHLPHNHRQQDVVYTGTHDNDTSLGWFTSLPADPKKRIRTYLGKSREPMPLPLVRAALASVAWLAVIPMQDLLSLGNEARMNRPGTTRRNWMWQLKDGQLSQELALQYYQLLKQYGRAPNPNHEVHDVLTHPGRPE